MIVHIEVVEEFPVFNLTDEHYGKAVVVDEETLARWTAANVAYSAAQAEMEDLLDPPCPECGDRTSRHQEWSAQWDRWACLDCKKCQHGIPADRKAN